MNNALVSPDELVYSYDDVLLGERIVQVGASSFPVASPLFWVECSDEVIADAWYYQTETSSCQLVPRPPEMMVNEYDQKLEYIRYERNLRLAASDWTQIADVVAAHDAAWSEAWNEYRQELRDMLSTITEANIDSVVYPIPPQ